MQTVQYWCNGHVTDSIALNDRGGNYGDGLFETLRWNGREFPLWNLHLERLERGCDRLLIPFSEERVEKAFQWLVTELQGEVEAIAKLTITRGQGGRGYSSVGLGKPTVIAGVFPISKRSDSAYQQGVSIRLCETTLAIQPLLAGIKHLNRLEQVLARAEWSDESVVEGILRDSKGNVIEGVSHNLFWISQGKLHTPALDECGVKGVMRRFILEKSEELGIAVSVERYPIAALALAEEVFLTNSISGVLPVKEIIGLQTYSVGETTKQLHQVVEKLWQGD